MSGLPTPEAILDYLRRQHEHWDTAADCDPTSRAAARADALADAIEWVEHGGRYADTEPHAVATRNR